MKRSRGRPSFVLTLTATASISGLALTGCAAGNGQHTASPEVTPQAEEQPQVFEVVSLANTIALPASIVPGARIMQETGLAFLMPDGRSVTIDTRSAEDFPEPVPMPDYPLYLLGLKQASTDDGLTQSQVDELTDARGVVTYGEDEPKKVRRFDTDHGTGYVATTDGEAFVYMVMDGYSAEITEVYIWGFSAKEVERWVDEGRFR